MAKTLDGAWDMVLQQIKKQVSPQSYDTWFAPTRQVTGSAGSICVEVPNTFFKDWLVDHYTEQINKALGQLDRAQVPVSYQISSTQTAPAHDDNSTAEKRSGFRIFQNPFERAASAKDSNFNPRYTFDKFVIGGCNRFSHAAALAVAESPAKSYNPLFIYGGVGLGKTHLMQAIGQHVLTRHPKLHVLYISSEKFTNQLISAIQNRTTQKFKDRYRHVDVLMVDDIQFLAGKESTQEEFFHTFNVLYDARKQIIVSSDRAPKEIPALENRLVSRFEWGLVTDMQPPDIETRVAILRKKLELSGAAVDDDVLLYIAENIKTNIRELEGALIRVIAYASLVGRAIDINSVKEVLQETPPKQTNSVKVDHIQGVVAQYFGIEPRAMRIKKRTKQLAFARQIAMYLSRDLTPIPLSEIGGLFGGRDHTTVLHACNKIESALANNPQLAQTIKELVTQIRASN